MENVFNKMTKADLLQLAADLARQVENLESNQAAQAHRVEPKQAPAYVQDVSDCLSMGAFANLVQSETGVKFSIQTAHKWLIDHGYVQKMNSANENGHRVYQKYLNQGLFKALLSTINGRPVMSVHITRKGFNILMPAVKADILPKGSKIMPLGGPPDRFVK